MARGSVHVPGRDDFLPLTGGTVSGKLTVTDGIVGNVTGNLKGDVEGNVTGNVTGDVTGNLTGNVTGNVTGSSSQWCGKPLRLQNNSAGTILLVLSGDQQSVDYITVGQITQDLDNRIRDCEAKYTAIAKTTEKLLRTSTFNVSGSTLIDNKLSYNFATMSSDVAFIRFSSSSSASKLLRGSSTYVSMDVYYNGGNPSEGDWTSISLRCTFNRNGVLNIVDENHNLYLNMCDGRNAKFSGTIYQYKYLA